MVFSAVPVCAAFPMDRLLLFMGIGAFGLIANLAHELGIFGSNAAPGARVRRFVVAALLVVHLPLAAAAFPLRTMTMMIFGDITNVAATVLPTDAAVPQQTFVFINGMDVMTFYFPLTRSLAGAPIPKRTCLLASITADNAVERLDDRTLLIRPRRGFLALDGDQLLRNASTKFSVGQTIQRPELVATIVETTDDGRPAAVRFEFKEELEHTSLQWFVWKNGELLRFVLPKVGERVEVPSTRFDIWIGRDRPVRILDLD
jgi:hypothetical protein